MNALRHLTSMQPQPQRLAAALQQRAPRGHVLAFITPEEAQILKARGGSGKVHADTGIRRYDLDSEGFDLQPPPPPDPNIQPIVPEGSPTGGVDVGGPVPQFGGTADASITGGYNQTPTLDFSAFAPTQPTAAPANTSDSAQLQPGPIDPSLSVQGDSTNVVDRQTGAPYGSPDPAPAPPTPDSKSGLFKGLDLGKLAMAGITGLLGSRAAKNAAAQGNQAKAETKQIAAPYQQMGQQLQAQAARGELSGSGQRAVQAMRAQLAQGISSRGGVGVAQAENQIAALRQKLLEDQWQLGLKISGIGDQIAIGAIQTGIQADRYVNDLTQSYFTNIARTLYGAPSMAPPAGGVP